MTFEEYLKQENATEHLRILEKNIIIVNDTISKLLLDKKNLSKKLAELEDTYSKKCVELEKTLTETKNSVIHSDNKILDAQKIMIESNKVVKSNEQSVLNLKERISELENEYNALKLRGDASIRNMEIERERLLNEIESAKARLDDIMDEVAERISIRNNTQDEITKFKLEQTDLLLDVSAKLKEKTKELTRLDKVISEEKDKIKMPLESLHKREIELHNREVNLSILIERFRKEFKKLHPNLDFKV